jgi:hypothetical protein
MMDASDAIFNGSKAVLGQDTEVLNCFFHVLQNVDKNKSKLKTLQLSEVKDDIWRLHLSPSVAYRAALTKATLAKWRAAGRSVIF